jgi:hypothetical protein
MQNQKVGPEEILTYQDMHRLFGIDDNFLPTSNGFGSGLIDNKFANSTSSISYFAREKKVPDVFDSEVTTLTRPIMQIRFIDQTSSEINNDAMTLLEIASLDRDVVGFQELVNKIPWSMMPASDLVNAIKMALNLEAPLIARKLAEKGSKYHPKNTELSKMARILAPPEVYIRLKPLDLNVKANKLWIENHREEFSKMWVALRKGNLIASGQTFSELKERIGDIRGKGILVTQVT